MRRALTAFDTSSAPRSRSNLTTASSASVSMAVYSGVSPWRPASAGPRRRRVWLEPRREPPLATTVCSVCTSRASETAVRALKRPRAVALDCACDSRDPAWPARWFGSAPRGEVSDELALVGRRGELAQAVGDAVGDDALVRSLLDVTVQGGAHLHQGVRRLLLVGLDRQHERRVQVGVHGVDVRAELLERDDGEDVSGSRGEVERASCG